MQQDMTKGSPLPVILSFTIPLIIGNVFQQLYNMADTIIVGRYVGAGALAAVGSTGTIMFLLTGFSQGMTAGFSVLTSQRFGARDEEGVRKSVANAILLSVLTTVVLTTLSLMLIRPLLRLMNTPEDIYADAYTYIMLISAGLAANIFYNLFSSLLRAVGNSKAPLVFLVFSACLNVLLDLFLIIHFDMGVAGAAVATNLSQGISAVLCVIYIYARVKELRPGQHHWRLERGDSKNQLRMGIPMAFQFAITASGAMIMQSAINLFGSTAVAAFTAANKLQNLIAQGMVAMGQTMATYAGQNFGSGQIKRIREGVRAALKAELFYSLAMALLVLLLLPHVLGLFFSGEANLGAALPWAKTYLYLCVAFYIPLSTIFIFRNTMQGCGYGLLPMLGGAAEFFARLIVASLSIHAASFVLACLCDPAAWVAAATFTGVSYYYVMKDIEKRRI